MTAADPTSAREAPAPDGARIEAILEALQKSAGPATWRLVEELLERLLDLHRVGIGRLLAAAREAAADPARLDRTLCDDEVVEGLLLLHDLHPLPLPARIDRALARAGRGRGLPAGAVALASVDATGRASIQLGAAPPPFARAAAERLIRRTVLDAAPEVREVEIVGLQATGRFRLPVLREPVAEGRP